MRGFDDLDDLDIQEPKKKSLKWTSKQSSLEVGTEVGKRNYRDFLHTYQYDYAGYNEAMAFLEIPVSGWTCLSTL